MLEDIFNIPAQVEISGKKYKAEYDFNGYAMLETLTGKGFYKLYDLLMVQNNITLNDSIEMVCCALLKHHKTEEIAEVREYLHKNTHAIRTVNNSIIGAFVAPMIEPEIISAIDEIKKKAAEMTEAEKTTI